MANAPSDAAMMTPDFKVSWFDSSFSWFSLASLSFFVTCCESKDGGFVFFVFILSLYCI